MLLKKELHWRFWVGFVEVGGFELRVWGFVSLQHAGTLRDPWGT